MGNAGALKHRNHPSGVAQRVETAQVAKPGKTRMPNSGCHVTSPAQNRPLAPADIQAAPATASGELPLRSDASSNDATLATELLRFVEPSVTEGRSSLPFAVPRRMTAP